jgi:predicted AAA+ superfamily ATPase
MIQRRIQGALQSLLTESPAVAMLGPRQVGKTTLALSVAEHRPSVNLDLESPADRGRISEPELYFADHADELVILDEIHRAPGIFEALRGTIDRGRREGRGVGRFLLLGSAAIERLAQTGETLAGRIAYVELDPFDISDLGGEAVDPLWLRGGFPESYLAASDAASLRWREDFIRTYLEREIPQLGPRIPAETLRRLWTMLAHNQGQLLNAAAIARGLGVSTPTVNTYLDLLVDLLLVRRLQPRLANVGKRQVRSPKTYVRDSGLLHALLGLGDKEALLGHPVLGASWEGYVIENLIALAPARVEPTFYRTSGGAEIDLVLRWPEGQEWAIEVKRSLSPRPTRGMRSAIEDLGPDRSFIVYPGEDRYRVAEGIEVVGLPELAADLIAGAP